MVPLLQFASKKLVHHPSPTISPQYTAYPVADFDHGILWQFWPNDMDDFVNHRIKSVSTFQPWINFNVGNPSKRDLPHCLFLAKFLFRDAYRPGKVHGVGAMTL